MPRLTLIETNGRLNKIGGILSGLKVLEARKKAVEMLVEKNALDSRTRTDYVHRVGVCYRCKNTIETLPLPQFFIKVEPLVKEVVKVLDSKETVVLGAGREKILREWLENLKDWNVSRQIVWGIRLPVWYDVHKYPETGVSFVHEGKKISGAIGELQKTHTLGDIMKGLQETYPPKEAEYVVSIEKPGDNYIQETNTFDTWFSSGQWPVVALKAKQLSSNSHGPITTGLSDFERFYPTTVMETGYDILPFWVMRMLMLCVYLEGRSPFKTVYLHGLVRDEKGQKMSKSKGNVINPIDMVDKYGADAIRMALVMSSTPGQDKAVGENTIKGMRNFSNKIWNASRYVLSAMTDDQEIIPNQLVTSNDQLFKTKLDIVVKEVTKLLDELRIGLAAEVVYNEFWHWFCDQAIEEAKQGKISHEVLNEGLQTWLKLIHPFAPFVTEAVWEELQNSKYQALTSKKMLISESWPN